MVGLDQSFLNCNPRTTVMIAQWGGGDSKQPEVPMKKQTSFIQIEHPLQQDKWAQQCAWFDPSLDHSHTQQPSFKC